MVCLGGEDEGTIHMLDTYTFHIGAIIKEGTEARVISFLAFPDDIGPQDEPVLVVIDDAWHTRMRESVRGPQRGLRA